MEPRSTNTSSDGLQIFYIKKGPSSLKGYKLLCISPPSLPSFPFVRYSPSFWLGGVLVLSTIWYPEGAGILRMFAKLRRTPRISSAAADVKVKVTVTLPASRRGAGGETPNRVLSWIWSRGTPTFSLSWTQHKKRLNLFVVCWMTLTVTHSTQHWKTTWR